MSQVIHLALLGCGVVGQGVLTQLKIQKKLLKSRQVNFAITKVLVRDPAKYQDLAREHQLELVTDIQDILTDPQIDIVIEVMGGFQPAEDYILACFAAGKHVVSANKNLIAKNGPLLIATAQENQVAFYYEGAVCGGVPILRTIAQAYSGDEIFNVAGIVNGTCNFILSQMSQKQLNYQEALVLAQKNGFAEADPTNDVAGWDASYKLVILAHFAYGRKVALEDLKVAGIENVTAQDIKMAQQIGYRIKLIAETKKVGNAITLIVWPTLVFESHSLGQIENENNGVFVKSNNLGEALYIGPGAGSQPTSNSVVTDLITVASEMKLNITGQTFHSFDEAGTVVPQNELQKTFVVFLTKELLTTRQILATIKEEGFTVTFQELKDNGLALFTQRLSFNEVERLEKFLDGKAYPIFE